MRGFRFFEELREGREVSIERDPRADLRGNVIAVNLSGGSFIQEGAVCFPAFCTTSEERALNAAVQPTYFNVEYLGKHCRRISETRARKIHPRLFEFLDQLA
jgi:hypothetical protein